MDGPMVIVEFICAGGPQAPRAFSISCVEGKGFVKLRETGAQPVIHVYRITPEPDISGGSDSEIPVAKISHVFNVGTAITDFVDWDWIVG